MSSQDNSSTSWLRDEDGDDLYQILCHSLSQIPQTQLGIYPPKIGIKNKLGHMEFVDSLSPKWLLNLQFMPFLICDNVTNESYTPVLTQPSQALRDDTQNHQHNSLTVDSSDASWDEMLDGADGHLDKPCSDLSQDHPISSLASQPLSRMSSSPSINSTNSTVSDLVSKKSTISKDILKDAVQLTSTQTLFASQVINAINEDLNILLQLSHHLFWSQICYNPSLGVFLDTFFHYFKMPSNGDDHDFSALPQPYQTLLQNVLNIVIRISTQVESSSTGFGDRATHAHILYQVLNLPSLIDFILLYAPLNLKLTQLITSHLFSIQKEYHIQLERYLSLTNKVFVDLANEVDQVLIHAIKSYELIKSRQKLETQGELKGKLLVVGELQPELSKFQVHSTKEFLSETTESISSSIEDHAAYLNNISITLHSIYTLIPESQGAYESSPIVFLEYYIYVYRILLPRLLLPIPPCQQTSYIKRHCKTENAIFACIEIMFHCALEKMVQLQAPSALKLKQDETIGEAACFPPHNIDLSHWIQQVVYMLDILTRDSSHYIFDQDKYQLQESDSHASEVHLNTKEVMSNHGDGEASISPSCINTTGTATIDFSQGNHIKNQGIGSSPFGSSSSPTNLLDSSIGCNQLLVLLEEQSLVTQLMVQIRSWMQDREDDLINKSKSHQEDLSLADFSTPKHANCSSSITFEVDSQINWINSKMAMIEAIISSGDQVGHQRATDQPIYDSSYHHLFIDQNHTKSPNLASSPLLSQMDQTRTAITSSLPPNNSSHSISNYLSSSSLPPSKKLFENLWIQAKSISVMVQDIFPGHSQGFLRLLLVVYYQLDAQRLIQDLLDNNIPVQFNSIDNKISIEEAHRQAYHLVIDSKSTHDEGTANQANKSKVKNLGHNLIRYKFGSIPSETLDLSVNQRFKQKSNLIQKDKLQFGHDRGGAHPPADLSVKPNSKEFISKTIDLYTKQVELEQMMLEEEDKLKWARELKTVAEIEGGEYGISRPITPNINHQDMSACYQRWIQSAKTIYEDEPDDAIDSITSTIIHDKDPDSNIDEFILTTSSLNYVGDRPVRVSGGRQSHQPDLDQSKDKKRWSKSKTGQTVSGHPSSKQHPVQSKKKFSQSNDQNSTRSRDSHHHHSKNKNHSLPLSK